MILNVIDDNNLLLFIIDKKKIPKFEEKELSIYLKSFFQNLKKKSSINIYGYYNVIIYQSNYYGMIIKLEKEELEYLSYYDSEIEMKIIASDNQVFYKIKNIEGINKKILDNSSIYLYNGEMYLNLNKEINFILLGNLLENSELLFEDTDFIKIKGKKKGD